MAMSVQMNSRSGWKGYERDDDYSGSTHGHDAWVSQERDVGALSLRRCAAVEWDHGEDGADSTCSSANPVTSHADRDESG